MGSWNTAEKTLVTALVLLITFLVVVAVNAVFGTATPKGEVYTYSFSYCAQWTNAYKSQTCVRYATGHEQRQNTRVQGLFWDYDSYKVVR